MSEEPKPEQEVEGGQVPAEGEQAPPAQDKFSQQQQQAYNKMMSTITKMNTKIEKVKERLNQQQLISKKTKTDEMTNKLIESKEQSEIITKEDLLSDITESYEKVVIGVYSENSQLKKKIQQMTQIIKQQNGKIYQHAQKEEELLIENEQLKAELLKMKDQRLMAARGQAHIGHSDRPQETISSKKKTNIANQSGTQNEDFDFWSMPQNEYNKKKKDFVQDSNLWVNQKESQDSPFLTENNQTSHKRKR